ncbi:MAG: hypothetical protein JNK82_06750, partial [Myxococcaceae bacterium]|nr:hypothetical protein [Myxococcaceae bacterium]
RAVSVEDGGVLTMFGGEVTGVVPEAHGVVTTGRLQLAGTTFKGSLRRAVHVERGSAEVTNLTSEGPAEAVHVSRGSARVVGSSARGGRGAAFFVSGGRLELRDVKVSAHEYGVQAGIGSSLVVDGLEAERVQLAGVAALKSTVDLRRVTVTRAGSHGAVELYECTSKLDGLVASDLEDIGLLVRLGTLDARNVQLARVRGSGGSGGDGVMVRDAVVKLADVFIIDIGGTGVVATAVATLDVDRLRCERCSYGALLVERHSTARAKGVVSVNAREAAVSLPDDGVLELDGLEVQGSGPALWAECQPGGRVVLKGKLPARELLSGRCLEYSRPPQPPDSGK